MCLLIYDLQSISIFLIALLYWQQYTVCGSIHQSQSDRTISSHWSQIMGVLRRWILIVFSLGLPATYHLWCLGSEIERALFDSSWRPWLNILKKTSLSKLVSFICCKMLWAEGKMVAEILIDLRERQPCCNGNSITLKPRCGSAALMQKLFNKYSDVIQFNSVCLVPNPNKCHLKALQWYSPIQAS